MKTLSLLSGRISAVILTALIFTSGLAFADHVILSEDGDNTLAIKKNSYTEFRVIQQVSDFNWINVKTEQGDFVELRIEGFSFSYDIGNPKLPVQMKLIEIPVDAVPRVEIVDYEMREYSLSDFGLMYPVIPAQPPYPKSDDIPPPFELNKATYNQDAFWKQELASVDVLGYMRGVRVARLNIAPFEYNPVSHKIRVYDNIEVVIYFDDAAIEQTKEMKRISSSPFFEASYNRLLNYKPLDSRDTITKYPVKFVIVSDPMFQEQLQPFVEWKTKKGFTVVEGYTDDPLVGSTTSSIKAYIQSLYNAGTTEDPAPSFVLFVGDVAQVPAWSASSAASDLNYCEFTGDYFPEIYFGRFSAQNPSQLQPQIDKTLQYEQYTMPDPSYLSEVVMVAGMDSGHGHDWGNGQINYGTENYFNEAHGITSHTYLYPESGSNSANIIQNVSDGVGFGNYTAHCNSSGWGDPSFTTSDVPGLQNQDKYGLLIGNCCSSNAFDSGECFGEALLRAENKGAVGYIGGSNSTMWDPDYYWGVGVGAITEDPPAYEETTLGAYDCAFHDHGEPEDDWYVTQYQIIYSGNLAVTEGIPSSAQYYWDIYCVMGDPSVMTYLGVPAEMIATYEALMPLATTSFTVNAEPYAYVAISKDGVLHGAAIADETGLANVTLDPITVPGTADVVVTGQNFYPFIGTVAVAAPDGPYVLLNEYQIDDALGNNNGQADFGEELLLNITLENVGNSDATNVTAVLSSDDENITITDNWQGWQDIASGNTSTENGAFIVVVNELIPDEHKVQFALTVTDGNESWNSVFSFNIYAPVIEVGHLSIDDSFAGNGNGCLDPGEMANIYITTLNTGHCDATGCMSYLETNHENVTIENPVYEIGTLNQEDATQAVFTVIVDPAASFGTTVDFAYQVISEPYQAEKTFTEKIGIIIEDFETGNFEAFDWTFGGDADWTISEIEAFSGIFSAKSGTISDQNSTTLQIIFDVVNDDSISFYRKVSSEANYDYLKFFIDNNKMGEWAGEQGWNRYAYPVNIGTHTFTWSYEKDYSVANGSDCAWVDYIIFPSTEIPNGPLSLEVNAYPEDLCFGDAAYLFAVPSGGTGNYTYEWSHAEFLNDPTKFNPIATIEETTEFTVSVSDGQDTLMGSIIVNIRYSPPAPTISQSGEDLLSSAVSGNQWYFWGEPVPGATEQVFTPTMSGEYYVTETSEYGCESEPSNMIYFVYVSVEEIDAESDLRIYPNPVAEKMTIRFTLKSYLETSITIFNAVGHAVMVINDGYQIQAGTYSMEIDVKALPSGVYYCKLETDDQTVVKKIIIAK